MKTSFSTNALVASLTERQQELLGLVRQGMSNKEVARALGISEGTVKQHLVIIFRQLKVANRTQAAQLDFGPTPATSASGEHDSFSSALIPVSFLTVHFLSMENLLHDLGSQGFGRFHRLLQQSCQKVAARWGGVVQGFPGGIIVLFGVPHIREDDPERAVCAALTVAHELTREMDDLVMKTGSLRMCVVTGKVVTCFDGDHTSILGELFTMACHKAPCDSRMAATLFFSRETMDAIAFLQRRHGPLSSVFACPGLPATASPPAPLPPFVGRLNELRELRERWHEAMHGHSKTLFVLGEAGFGKSRLLRMLREEIPADCRWLPGFCRAMAREIPFHPFWMILHAMAGGEPDTPVEQMTETLATYCQTLPQPLQEECRLFLQTRHHPMPADPTALSQLMDRLATFFVQLWQGLPGVVVCLDNLQWADPHTRHLLPRLFPLVNGTTIWLLGAGRRSELRNIHTHPGVETLSLRRLTPRESEHLLTSMDQTLANREVESLATWCGGVPLFAVETMLAGPVQDRHQVPDTLLGLVLERLDAAGVDWAILRAVAAMKELPLSQLLALRLHPEETTTLAGVERLVRLGVLVEQPLASSHKLSYVSGVVRTAVWQTLPARDRLHGRPPASGK